ncbi:MAG: hypothetical protein OHK0046_42090 [Anaerolineae bacterium]
MSRQIHVFMLTLLGLLFSAVFISAQTEEASQLRIAFVSNRDGSSSIYVMQTDGSNQVSLTGPEANDWNPQWSPTGGEILFNSDRDGRDTLYIMDFDGSNVRALFPGESFQDYEGAWSPDSERIAFVSNRAVGRELFVVDRDGSNVRQLTDEGRLVGDPYWSPDGTEIVYWELSNDGEILLYRRQVEGEIVQLISTTGSNAGSPLWIEDTIYFDSNRDGYWALYRMGENGEFPERIGPDTANSGRATVSPDGRKVAFISDGGESDEIYIMNPDGTNVEQLTNNEFSDHSPAWQPAVPVNQAPPPTAVPVTLEVGAEPTVAGPALGLNVNGVQARPITKETLLIDYGIRSWHEAGWTGAGQRIGVIDTAFGKIDQFISGRANVNLPPGVVATSYTLDNNDHGTDVLEVIHTVAPSAVLYACRYDGSLSALRDCTDWLQAENVRIINHSVGLPVLPLDGNHEYAQLVDRLFQQGVFWVNASGNFNRGYVSNIFRDSEETPDSYHNFTNAAGETELVVSASASEPYAGTILLSWNNPEGRLINPETNLPERVDLDLEIVNRITGAMIASGTLRQGPDTTLPLFEIVRVPETAQPFEVRVRNAGVEFEVDVRFALFVEFQEVSNLGTLDNVSVVAPADASNAFTVSAVDGAREITEYSSFGEVLSGQTSYPKPQIAAPGEIYMDDGTPFIGTSAAAPVVSGMAALLLEQNTELRTDQLPRQFTEVWRVPIARNTRYGAGIVQLGAPPTRQSVGGVIDTAPYTVFPRAEEVFVDTSFRCSTALPTRLEIGIPGYVHYDLGLAIRNGPGTEFSELVRLEFGTDFTVIGGPECQGSSIWWLVELENGADGWVSEGIDYYLITPDSLERAQLPTVYNTTCPNALDSQLTVGDRARVLLGGRFFFRGEGANAQMQPLSEGAIVEILGGPTCEGQASNELRWYVRVIEGDSDQIGYEGWLSEGGTESRNLLFVES